MSWSRINCSSSCLWSLQARLLWLPHDMQSSHCSLWSAWTLHPSVWAGRLESRIERQRERERERDGGRERGMWNNSTEEGRLGSREGWWGWRRCHLGFNHSSSFFPPTSLSSLFFPSYPRVLFSWHYLIISPPSLTPPLCLSHRLSDSCLYVQVLVPTLHHSHAINWRCMNVVTNGMWLLSKRSYKSILVPLPPTVNSPQNRLSCSMQIEVDSWGRSWLLKTISYKPQSFPF